MEARDREYSIGEKALKMQTMTTAAALQRLREQCPDGGRVYMPGCAGEPLMIADALRATPDLASGMTFLGIWIPGVNRTDYAGLHPTAKSELIFLSKDFRESFVAQRAKLRPLSYTQAYAWLETSPLDAMVIEVTPADENGAVSLGVSADFSPAVWRRKNALKIAHVNAAMPRPTSSPTIALDAFDIVIEKEAPLLTVPPATLAPAFDAIAANIASLINDGDILQFGLGNVQLALLRALSKKKNLRIHSGMVSDPVVEALDANVISAGERAITTGVALGSPALYDIAARDPRFHFAPVGYTHAIGTLSRIENFTAINSVIEIDLFGQANAEYIGGRQISGAGGLVDFLRGAAAARNGKPIVALTSSAKGGAISRIVPKIEAPSVAIARADVGIVVTENGIADLRGMTIEERANALIGIAHRDHQASLRAAWSAMRDNI